MRRTVFFGSASLIAIGLWTYLVVGYIIDQSALSQSLIDLLQAGESADSDRVAQLQADQVFLNLKVTAGVVATAVALSYLTGKGALFLPRLKRQRHLMYLIIASLASVIAANVWQYFHPLPVWKFE